MIHLDCARRVAAISLTAILILSAGPAAARSRAPIPVPTPKPAIFSSATGDDNAAPAVGVVTTAEPTLNIIAEEPAPASYTPTFVRSLRHIYCVEFARIRSGIAIFGDARTWWDHAKGQYARGADPSPGAVMVFAATRKMTRGHVAVVKRIVSNREVIVDHANWRRDGNIYLNAPVIDVSANNDWSKVRVFDPRGGQMGSNVYPIKGFVSRTALN
jgi:hypothetical protein